MRQRNEHAMSPDTWCGLNRPDRTEKDMDAVIFGIPFDGGVSYRGGAAQAPDLLRANTILPPKSWNTTAISRCWMPVISWMKTVKKCFRKCRIT